MYGQLYTDNTRVNTKKRTGGCFWVKEVATNTRSFIICTSHDIDLHRRTGTIEAVGGGLFVEEGQRFLSELKDELLHSLRLSMEAASRSDDTFIEGNIDGFRSTTESFIHVEVSGRYADLYFISYRSDTKQFVLSGDLLDVGIYNDPVRFRGHLNVGRDSRSGYAHDEVGVSGRGLRYLNTTIDIKVLIPSLRYNGPLI